MIGFRLKLVFLVWVMSNSALQGLTQPTWEHVSNIVMATYPTSVFTSDSGFVEAGFTIDTITDVHLSYYLREWSNHGELLNFVIYYDSLSPFFLTSRSHTKLSDTTSVFMNANSPPGENIGIKFYRFSELQIIESFTEDTVSIGLQEIPRNLIMRRLYHDDSGNYYSVGDFLRANGGTDFFIMKYNSSNERSWSFCDTESFSLESALTMCFDDLGNVYIPYYRSEVEGNSRLLTLNSEGIAQSDIEISSKGIWSDCIRTESNQFILVGRNISGGINRGALIACCSDNGVELWSQLQDGGNDVEYIQAGFKRIARAFDGNYIVSGTLFEPTETPDPEDDPYNYVICFRKITETGEMLWERRYQKVDSYRDHHDLTDMTLTTDGGIAAVVMAQDRNEEFPEVGHPQRAWILKLDECGCLVPGCDSSCPEIEESGSSSPYYFGPNPASNLFSVGSSTMDKYSFSIYDDLGRLILEKQNAQKDMGYVVDVENWSSGVYFLHIQDQEGKGHVEKVVVE